MSHNETKNKKVEDIKPKFIGMENKIKRYAVSNRNLEEKNK